MWRSALQAIEIIKYCGFRDDTMYIDHAYTIAKTINENKAPGDRYDAEWLKSEGNSVNPQTFSHKFEALDDSYKLTVLGVLYIAPKTLVHAFIVYPLKYETLQAFFDDENVRKENARKMYDRLKKAKIIDEIKQEAESKGEIPVETFKRILREYKSTNITLVMEHGTSIYYVTDEDEENRLMVLAEDIHDLITKNNYEAHNLSFKLMISNSSAPEGKGGWHYFHATRDTSGKPKLIRANKMPYELDVTPIEAETWGDGHVEKTVSIEKPNDADYTIDVEVTKDDGITNNLHLKHWYEKLEDGTVSRETGTEKEQARKQADIDDRLETEAKMREFELMRQRKQESKQNAARQNRKPF